MTILLLGEYSALHKNLKEGLNELGYEALIASDGDGWKNIPRDIDLFRARLQIPVTAPLLIYAGSVGPQYCLTEMLQLFARVHQQLPVARLLILTGSPELLPVALQQFPGLQPFVTVLSVPAHAVPEYLACADLGLALRKRSFSMQGVAPVKLGEYLLCGLPVITSNGIGDSAIIAQDAGFLLDFPDEKALQMAADWFVGVVLSRRENFRIQSGATGKGQFSLEASVAYYPRKLFGFGALEQLKVAKNYLFQR